MWNQLLQIGQQALTTGAQTLQKKGEELLNHAEYEVNEIKAGRTDRFFQKAPQVAQTLSNPVLAPLIDSIYKGQELEGAALEKAGDWVEERTGIPSLVTQVIAGVAIPGGGEIKAGVKAGGRALLRTIPAKPAYALTIKNKDLIARGVQQGSASGPTFGPAMTKWRNRRMELREQMRNPSGNTPHRRQQNARGSKEVAYNDVSTGPTTDPLDVVAYGRGAHKVKGKQQHHLFPKQESYQFVERMNQLGDEDDVLNLFLYAEEVDATMGGRLSDILNMDTKPHSKLHSNRIKDGRQLGSMEMWNLVESAKSTDELMTLFNRYVTENIKPSKAEARKLQQAFEQAKTKQKKFNSLTIKDRQRL